MPDYSDIGSKRLAEMSAYAREAERASDKLLSEHERRMDQAREATLAPTIQAKSAVRDIVAEIKRFESEISAAEEAQIIVIGGPAGHTISPQIIEPKGHDRILFEGIDQDGCRVRVLQHVAQLNIMIKAIFVGEEKANRIGFHSPNEDPA
ncbi:MAG: hypothetical protein KDE55_08225 [Novosphingobium sp.]|nr:hypothetical protein [Novosphingobium sp.]